MKNDSKNRQKRECEEACEREFIALRATDSDEALLLYVRSVAEQLGRLPGKKDIPGASLLKCRFGPWPRMLEKAGLKPPKAKDKK